MLKRGKCHLKKIVHVSSYFSTVLFPVPPSRHFGVSEGPMDVRFTAPYNEKNQLFGRNQPLAARVEIHDQSAQNGIPHEGQPAAERAQGAGPLGGDADLRAHSSGAPGSAYLRAARWSALRQRSHPSGHCYG